MVFYLPQMALPGEGARPGMLPDTTTARYVGATWGLVVCWRTLRHQSLNSEWAPSLNFKLRVTEELQEELEYAVLVASVRVTEEHQAEQILDTAMEQMDFQHLLEASTYIFTREGWKMRTEAYRVFLLRRAGRRPACAP